MDSTFSGWQDPYYRALFDNPAYGICRADRFGKFAEVNQTLVSMLGYESAEDLGASELQFDLNGSNPAYDQLFGKRYPEGQNTPYLELEWKRKDGVPIKVRISGRAVHVANGEIHGYQLIVENIDEQRALEQQLRSVAHTDGLTGLPNYRALEDVLQGELRRAGRTGRGFSLLLLDVDGMKAINDASGHLQGNRALCRVAAAIRQCCRSVDTAARFGGDEFAIVLPETTSRAAWRLAVRIFNALEQDHEDPKLSVSLGCATYPTDAQTSETLLQAADKELYEMKHGRQLQLFVSGQFPTPPPGDANPPGHTP